MGTDNIMFSSDDVKEDTENVIYASEDVKLFHEKLMRMAKESTKALFSCINDLEKFGDDVAEFSCAVNCFLHVLTSSNLFFLCKIFRLVDCPKKELPDRFDDFFFATRRTFMRLLDETDMFDDRK